MSATEDPVDVATLRVALREVCDECETCTADEADEPTDAELAQWIAEHLEGEGHWLCLPLRAWTAHVGAAWDRLHPAPRTDALQRVVRYGSVE